MRISDWSSDVCSSDLVAAIVDEAEHQHAVAAGDLALHADELLLGFDAIGLLGFPGQSIEFIAQRRVVGRRMRQIGRASCRERVWQNDTIPVIVVYLQQ